MNQISKIAAQLLNPLYEVFSGQTSILQGLLAPLKLDPANPPVEESKRIDIEQVHQCFKIAKIEYQIDDIGLQIGSKLRAGNLGEFSYLLLSCADFADLQQNLCHYYPVVSNAIKLTCHEDKQQHLSYIELSPANTELSQSIASSDLAVASLVASLLHAMPDTYRPARIDLPWRSPAYAANYVKYLACDDIHFEQASIRVYSDSKWLQTKLPAANAALKKLFITALDLRLQDLKSVISIVEKIDRYLGQVETLKSITLVKVAVELNIGERTLHRQLNEYGTSFRALLGDYRSSKAIRFLSQGRSVDEITHYLGFSERAAFDRAFKKWFGITAIAFQKEYAYLDIEFSVEDIVNADNIPSMPAVANQLLETLSNDSHDMEDIAKIVESDAPLSIKLLGLANSAMYGAVKVNNIKDAIIKVFGVDTLRNLSIAMLANNCFDVGKYNNFSAEYYWRSSLSVGYLCSSIARHAQHPDLNPADCYLMGLLHNIGLLYLMHKMPEKMNKALYEINQLTGPRPQLCKFQESFLGTNTCSAGAMLFSFWNLPRYLGLVLNKLTKDDFKGDQGTMTLLLSSAEQYCRQLLFEGDKVELNSKALLMKRLNIKETTLNTCLQELEDQQAEIQSIVGSLI